MGGAFRKSTWDGGRYCSCIGAVLFVSLTGLHSPSDWFAGSAKESGLGRMGVR